MNSKLFKELFAIVNDGKEISEKAALELLTLSADKIPLAMGLANELKLKHFGNTTHLCSITNVKSGACSEDCTFCAQSAHNKTEIDIYKMRESESIRNEYEEVSSLPIDRFGVVAAAEGVKDKDIDKIIEAINKGETNSTHWCGSLGIVSDEDLQRLIDAGMKRYHHNLETAESYFENVCTTHPYTLRLDMVRRVVSKGLSICCGGILGIGESLEQRYELAKTLYDEKVDAIPLNFHVPIKGTKLENMEVMKPMDILRTIIMFRFVNPKAEIKIAAGRIHMRDLQSMIFAAGATGMMIGKFLTVAGRDVETDIQMLKDLEIDIEN